LCSNDEEATVGQTGACAEIFTITVPEQLEADYARPVTHESLAAVVEEQTEPVADDAFVDVDLHGDDRIGL
jgi:hypothetical protein